MFDANALFDRLQSREQPTEPGELKFATLEIPEWPGYHIGRTWAGEAALLIETAEQAESSAPAIRLQSLAVYHNATCRVRTSSGESQEREFTVIWHLGGEPSVRRYFLGMLAPTVASLGPKPTAAEVSRAVDALSELFRALARPSRRSTQGLWAELLLITRAKDAEALAKVWHADPQERFDFSSGGQRIEVKCASGVRKHHFAMEQLAEQPDSQVVVASFLTTRATGGTALQELLERALKRLAALPHLQAHVNRAIADTLGMNLSQGLLEAFDEQLAAASLRFFRASDVPRVPTPLPAGVTEVRFVADLSNVDPMSRRTLATGGGLFATVADLVS